METASDRGPQWVSDDEETWAAIVAHAIRLLSDTDLRRTVDACRASAEGLPEGPARVLLEFTAWMLNEEDRRFLSWRTAVAQLTDGHYPEISESCTGAASGRCWPCDWIGPGRDDVDAARLDLREHTGGRDDR